MEKRIRIKDIAERAGVSTGTVDRVLHNRGSVSSKARKKVLDVLDEMDYKRNIIASTLAYNRIFNIAALLPSPDKDPFWQQPKEGIKLAMESVQHYSMLLKFYHFDSNTEDFKKQSKQVLKDKPDAILLAPEFSKEGNEFLADCADKKIPYALINTNIQREDISKLVYIGQDSFQSGVLAGRLLLETVQKEQNILIINLEKKAHNAAHLINKEKGFRAYLSEYGFDQGKILKFDFEAYDNPKALNTFLQEQVQDQSNLGGIFITNSRAYKVAEFLKKEDKKAIKLVGFDLVKENIDFLKEGYINYLINQNPFKQGYLGILNIFNHLILKKVVDPIQHLPLDIVVPENIKYYQQEEISLQVIL